MAELAGAVYLSQGTVRNPISAAIGKLDARNRLDAMQIAEDAGWLCIDCRFKSRGGR